MDDKKTSPVDSVTYLRRLGRLFTQLAAARFSDAEAVWALQLKLLKLQQHVQREISALKLNDGTSAGLEDLRWTRHQARRFGDAFAWVILGNQRNLIYPLARNSPVPIPEEGPSSDVVVRMARDMWAQGWGFPLLHDVTNVLRLGDVTFVSVDPNVTHTVEIKSSKIRELSVDTAEFAVTAYFAKMPSFVLPEREGPDEKRSKRRRPARLTKQLARISTALEIGASVGAGATTLTSGERHLSVQIESGAGTYWDSLAAACRRARRSGYASFAADNVTLYFISYSESGAFKEVIEQSSMVDDLQASGIMGSQSGDSVNVFSIPSHHDRNHPELYLPFYLYPLPKSTILDLTHGRMAITALTNLGRVLDSLRSAGFDARSDGQQITLRGRYVDAEGAPLHYETNALNGELWSSLAEFRSLSYLITAATSIVDTIVSSDVRPA